MKASKSIFSGYYFFYIICYACNCISAYLFLILYTNVLIMKANLLTTLLFFVALNSYSQDLIAVQNGGTPTFFEDLSQAIEASVAGDTLYIPGRSYIVNDTINKPIHLIGTGINPNYSQACGITSISSSNITWPQIVLGENADGGSIIGIRFTSNAYNGIPYNNLITGTNEISNYLIDRCFFGSNVSGKFLSSLIKNNIFFARASINAENSNSLFCNNIINSNNNSFINCIVSNNIFLLSGDSFYQIINNGESCLIENNIFKIPTNYVIDNIAVINLFVRNNINVSNGITNTNIRSNNFDNDLDLSSLFVNYSGNANDAINFTVDFHLVNGSAYINGGADGTQVGIYGGRFPWKDSMIPYNPHISAKNISGTTDSNGNLPINIEVKAQQN